MGKKIQYVWTPRDRDREAVGFNAKVGLVENFVTPYGHLPGKIPKASLAGPGSTLEVDLALSGQPGYAWRYTDRAPKSQDAFFKLVWQRIPADLLGASTLGELCENLHKKRPKVYPAFLYAPASLGFKGDNDAQWAKMPQLLFDYWDNSKLRYDLVKDGSKTGFSWKMDPRKIPAGKDREWSALMLMPIVIKSPVLFSVGSQSLLTEADLTLLNSAARQLYDKATRVVDLLAKSEAAMKQRSLVLAGFGALHVLFQCSAANVTGGSVSAAPKLGKHIETILPIAKKAMLEAPMAELLSDKLKKTPGMSPRMREALVGLQGVSNDMAADIKLLSLEIHDVLFKDAHLMDLCKRIFGDALTRKEMQTETNQKRLVNVLNAVNLGLFALAETSGSEKEADDLWKMFDKVKKPAAARADMTGDNLVEVLLSLVGTTAPTVALTTTLVGNLAGPPSLSIAIAHAAAAWSVPGAAKLASMAGGGSMTKVQALQAKLFKFFDKFDNFKELEELKRAISSNDQQKIFDLKPKFGEAVAGKAQVTPQWKAFSNLLQFVGLVAAIQEARKKIKEGDGSTYTSMVFLVNMASAGTQGVQAAAGAYETLLTCMGKFDEVAPKFAKVGVQLGRVSALLGLVMGAIQMYEASKANDMAGQLAGALSFMGSAFMLMAYLPYCAACPQLALIGLTLVAIGIIISIVSGEEPVHATAINKIALAVLSNMKGNDFFWAIYPDIEVSFKALSDGISKEYLAYASNQPNVRESLKRVGFSPENITALCGGQVSSFGDVASAALVKALPQLLYKPPAI